VKPDGSVCNNVCCSGCNDKKVRFIGKGDMGNLRLITAEEVCVDRMPGDGLEMF